MDARHRKPERLCIRKSAAPWKSGVWAEALHRGEKEASHALYSDRMVH